MWSQQQLLRVGATGISAGADGETTTHGGDEGNKLLACDGVSKMLHIRIVVDVASGSILGWVVNWVRGSWKWWSVRHGHVVCRVATRSRWVGLDLST